MSKVRRSMCCRPRFWRGFSGQEKLYFALATFSNGKGSAEIVKVPTPGSPYINLQGLSGRSLTSCADGAEQAADDE